MQLLYHDTDFVILYNCQISISLFILSSSLLEEHIFTLKSEFVPPPQEKFSCSLLYYLKIKTTALTLLNELFLQSLQVYMPKQYYNNLPKREINRCKLTWLNLVNRKVNCGHIIFFSYVVQFYLDMKFVVCFASHGRYLSRNLQRIVNEIITKAMAAFSATGMDPYR